VGRVVRVIPVIHNVSSVQRLTDMARLVYGLGYRLLVVTKPQGAAAQYGVPEASRIAFRSGGSIAVLPDLSDALEVFKPTRLYVFTAEYAGDLIDPTSPGIPEGSMLAFNGGDPDFTPQEARMGTPVYIRGASSRLGALAEASIVLFALASQGSRG